MCKIKQTAAWLTVLLFLVGCSGGTFSSPDFSAPFSCTLRAEKGERAVSGVFSRQLIGCYTLELQQPEALAGMTFTARDGAVTVTYRGLTLESDTPLPAQAYFSAVTRALDAMARMEAPVPVYADDGSPAYAGRTELGAFTVIYDRDMQYPVALQTDNGITVQFFDYLTSGAGPS